MLSKNLKIYELSLIVGADVLSQCIQDIGREIQSLLSKSCSGTAELIAHTGVRNLAYPIKKHTKGRYYFIKLLSSPKDIKSIDGYLQLNESIIRFMITKIQDESSMVKGGDIKKWFTEKEPLQEDSEYENIFV